MSRASDVWTPLGLNASSQELLSMRGAALELPIRSEIFGPARLAEHGRSLAAAQAVAGPGESRSTFFPRLEENVKVLRQARNLLQDHAQQGHHLAPAAGWLIDNGTLLEQQLETVREGLPRRYYDKLPRVKSEALAGLPRVYGLAWAWVAHTDSGLDEELLATFLSAYQQESELTLAELWAIPTTLRVVLIENLRRMAERAATTQAARDAAHRWVESTDLHHDAVHLERLGQALQARGVLEIFALQLQRRSDEWLSEMGPEVRAWLSVHLPDPAGALQRQQQGAAEDHQSVRNAVTALRGLDDVDWRELFMGSSTVLRHLARLPVFMDESEATQDTALRHIETLAHRARLPESKVSAKVAELAGAASGAACAPLHWLDGEGLPVLRQALGLSPHSLRTRASLVWRRAAPSAYVILIALASATLVQALLHHQALQALPLWMSVVTALLLLGPASEAVIAVLNRLISESVAPKRLPRLSLSQGVPASHRPLVVMPVMLSSLQEVRVLVAQLEQHHLANPEAHAQFALLSDGVDAPTQHLPNDQALLTLASDALRALNLKHPAPPGQAARFLLLHRARSWSDSEQAWIGWERKRGKMEQLVTWLVERAASPFADLGPLSQPAPGIRSILTLDSDTNLPPGRLRELVSVAAHPLNTPQVDLVSRQVTRGYTILQPRVAVPLPLPGSVTPYHWLFSGHWGVDPYSMSSSEIYQDVFSEGTYTGKGLVDVAAFHATLSQRLPQAQVLSHDLLEGSLARCAAVSDITLVEDSPSLPDVAAARLHRWTRGDWQLLPFVLRAGRWPLAGINRWKMVDNLRRSLVAPLSLVLMLWCVVSGSLPVEWALLLVAAAYGAAPLIGALASLAPQRDDLSIGLYFRRSVREVWRALLGTTWYVAQLLLHAVMYTDAIARALTRQFVTRRKLLEWTTAASSQASAATDLWSVVRSHWIVPAWATAFAAGLSWAAQQGAPVALGWGVTLCVLWGAAPLWVWLGSRRVPNRAEQLDVNDRAYVRQLARDTWRYYERYVGEADHHLPPDNVQFVPHVMIAHRTSPTNIGMYLLSAAASRELGFLSVTDLAGRLEKSLGTLEQLPKWRGHLYNWYDTQSLVVLTPAYVSAVDSGNLSGHLLLVAAACEALTAQDSTDWLQAPAAVLESSAASLRSLATSLSTAPGLAEWAVQGAPRDAFALGRLQQQLPQARRELTDLLQGQLVSESDALMVRLDDHLALLETWLQDRTTDVVEVKQRLQTVASTARRLALAADFKSLYNPKRRLLHIGHRVDSNQLDLSHYDLLASESRLASLVAIAKGDVPPRHWAALGRPVFAGKQGVGLKSWSGSMFEYLMPTLVLDEPAGSLLFEATRSAVAVQRAEAAGRRTPWGISESAVAVRDHTLAYQYGPQGVANLALRQTPTDERVIAPYAAAMALVVAPQAAVDNLRALELLGARGTLGFIEALDYTPHRQSADSALPYTLVETYMAHHQAMSLLACVHVLTAGVVRRWAATEPYLRAVLPLLHEPAPNQAPPLREPLATPLPPASQRLRWQFDALPSAAVPPTHLLGNGRYGVALRANGAGHSQWQGHGLNRWRDDVLQDQHGIFTYLRRDTDSRWASLSSRPAPDEAAQYRTEFHPDRVVLRARWPDLSASTTVSVSTEDDCELRRVELHNTGRKPLTLTLAMAFEVTLAPQRADEAHPAFSNLFIESRWLHTERALYMQRKPRLPHEPSVHAVHFLAECDDPQAEVDAFAARARWMGRLGSAADPVFAPAGPKEDPHASTLYTGLDPASAITVQVTVPPGATRTLTFVVASADNPSQLESLVDRYRQPSGPMRALSLSDTLARIRLRELRLDPDTWAAWLHLNTLSLNALTRTLPTHIANADRRLLWRHSITGDRPLILAWVESVEGIDMVRHLVSMLPLWSAAGTGLDLVVINTEPSSYLASVQQALNALMELAAHQLDSRRPADRQATLRVLQGRDLPADEVATLRLLSHVSLRADGRPLVQHLERLRLAHESEASDRTAVTTWPLTFTRPGAQTSLPDGQFEPTDSAYRFAVSETRYPGRPWVNVLANPAFGGLVSEAGAGFTWAGNSRLHQVTAWSNDALSDPSSEAVFLEDLDAQRAWVLGRGVGVGPKSVTHGLGFTRITQTLPGLEVELVWCVDTQTQVKQLQVNIECRSPQARRLRLVGFAEWTLGGSRKERASLRTRAVTWDLEGSTSTVSAAASAPRQALVVQATQLDAATHHGQATAFLGWHGETVAVPSVASSGAGLAAEADWTSDRREFHDARGRQVLPVRLGRRSGIGLDACAGIGHRLHVGAGRTAQATLLLGHADSVEAADQLARQAWAVTPAERLARQRAQWPALLNRVQVETPDPLFDALVNRWLPYQAISCRLWARAGFYQAGGAFGFRDQLQDAMCLVDQTPQLLAQQIVLHAGRQFIEGDVQHWWHVPTGAGVRTKMSDDLLWLPLAVAHYLRRTGDAPLLERKVPFLHSAPVPADREDLYEVPAVSEDIGTVYEHAARAIDHSLRTGLHGLPLMGTGDWNDGMNRVGHDGRGESVWLGWFLSHVIDAFAPVALQHGEAQRVQRWRVAQDGLKLALEREGWDGHWYRRAFFDDGSPLGSASNTECRIDLIAQAWSVLSGAGDASRAKQAMDSVRTRLWDPEVGVVKLLDPPLAHAVPSAGYIQAYPPGIRENGGQYNHAAVWALMAFARQGDADAAWRMFTAVSPAHRSADPQRSQHYGLEPFVAAGDIYSQGVYAGRGGWSWYTGSASWLQRAGIESLCGLCLEGRLLTLTPCLPTAWPVVTVTVRQAERHHRITLCQTEARAKEQLALDPRSQRVAWGDTVDLEALPQDTPLVMCATRPAAARETSQEPMADARL